MKTAYILIGILSLFLISCSKQDKPLVEETEEASLSPEEEVFYLIVPASFYDSDGNEMGDINGIIEKLDYVQELGVTSIIFLPLYPSPYYHNYFADDFEGIDEDYGTMEDYLNFIREVHDRGMKFYLDTEYQYVTENHEWYKNSLNNPESKYSDHVFYQDSLNEKPATIIFNVEGLNAHDGKYTNITTVNLYNEEVNQYMIDQFKFWMDPNGDGDFSDGVDGFRIDHMMDNLDGKDLLTDMYKKFWGPLIQECKTLNPSVLFIAEQADWTDYGQAYFEDAGIDIVYAFNALFAIDQPRILSNNINTLIEKTPQGKYQFLFLGNHDLDRFASKVMDHEQIKCYAAMLYLGKGIPFINYGQEIGMKGKFLDLSPYPEVNKPNDGDMIGRREAMEWYASTEGKGMAHWYRETGPWWDSVSTLDNDGVSVEEQINDPNSLLSFYKNLIHLRKESPSLATGVQQVIDFADSTTFAFTRGDDHLLVFNPSDASQTVTISPEDHSIGEEVNWSVLMEKGKLTQLQDQSLEFDLPPYGLMVLKSEDQ